VNLVTKPLRAYAVTEHDENTGGIIFARHDIAARKAGANEYGDGELTYVSCRRAPWADHCAETGIVPAKLMIDFGWHFECHGCGARIDVDWLRENRLPLDGVCGSQNGWVFCCARCKWRHKKYLGRERAAKDDAIEAFKAIIRARFGDVEFVERGETGGHHVYVVEGERGGWHWSQVHVAFKFPGMQIGPAHLVRDEPHGRGRNGFIGPTKPHYTCCGGDREAFEKFAAETKP
jgi:hypothetical protein